VVGAGPDGSDNLVGFGGRKNELDVGRGFFHNFQQGVEACRGDHVGFVDNENLVAIPRGGEGGPFAQVAGVVYATVGGRVNLDHVQGS
jgi:hypothetical protein